MEKSVSIRERPYIIPAGRVECACPSGSPRSGWRGEPTEFFTFSMGLVSNHRSVPHLTLPQPAPVHAARCEQALVQNHVLTATPQPRRQHRRMVEGGGLGNQRATDREISLEEPPCLESCTVQSVRGVYGLRSGMCIPDITVLFAASRTETIFHHLFPPRSATVYTRYLADMPHRPLWQVARPGMEISACIGATLEWRLGEIPHPSAHPTSHHRCPPLSAARSSGSYALWPPKGDGDDNSDTKSDRDSCYALAIDCHRDNAYERIGGLGFGG